MSIHSQQAAREYEQRQASMQARNALRERVIVCAIFAIGALLVLLVMFGWE